MLEQRAEIGVCGRREFVRGVSGRNSCERGRRREKRCHDTKLFGGYGRLVGLVSERNLLTTLNVDAGEVRDVLVKRVGDVMTTPVVAANPLTDIRRIARVMLDRDVDGVPIVNETGVLLGFVSRSDILRAVVTDPPLSMWR